MLINVHSHPSRRGVGVCAALAALSTLSPACFRNIDPAGASVLVEELFLALESREPARIQSVAPALEKVPGAIEQISDAFHNGIDWSIVETRRNGRSTIVIVDIKPDDPELRPVQIGVPVRFKRGEWEILNEITITQSIGTVTPDGS